MNYFGWLFFYIIISVVIFIRNLLLKTDNRKIYINSFVISILLSFIFAFFVPAISNIIELQYSSSDTFLILFQTLIIPAAIPFLFIVIQNLIIKVLIMTNSSR